MSHAVDDTYDSYVETVHRARKEHRCGACRETIAPGHRYARVYILWLGEKRTIKRCARCQALHVHLRELGKHRELWPAEQLNCGESYEAEWGECPDDVAALAFALPGEVTL